MTDAEIKQGVADKIKRAIESYGINRKEFAILMNVPPSTVTKWLSGMHNFTTNTIFDIESKLKIRIINTDK